MNIAFIVDVFPSLSETFILNQITGLMDSGNKVSVFAGKRPGNGRVSGKIKKYGILDSTFYHNDKPGNRFTRVIKAVPLFFVCILRDPKPVIRSLNFFKYGKDALSLSLFYAISCFIMAGKFDIIMCHFGPNGNLGALLKEMGILGKLVVMFHGYDIRRGIEKGGAVYEKLFARADVLLSISEYNYRHLIEFGADPERIKYHPVGVDINDFKIKDHLSSDSPPRGKIKVLTVARLVDEKGVKWAIEAFDLLANRDNLRDVEYIIAGSGPLGPELRKMVKEKGLEGLIKFYGPCGHEDIPELYRQADIFLLPSIAEALPVVLMEAEASGLPVVATSAGSTYQLVNDGVNGFIVPPRDAEMLAGKLKYLILHPELWEDMGKNGRKIIEENYDIDVLNRRLMSLFEKLLGSYQMDVKEGGNG
ncbi:MAG: glycosyltransferase [Candidatus Omnitrophota bacterium]